MKVIFPAAFIGALVAFGAGGLGAEIGSIGTSQQAGSSQSDMQQSAIQQDQRTVRQVQRKLQQEGYDVGPIDGQWGPQTQQALRRYQQDNHMPSSGQLNRQTLAELGVGQIGPVTTAQETIELPPDVIEGFYITLDDVRTRSDEVYEALAGAAGDPISQNDFVGTKLPDKVVPEEADRELLQRLFSILDINSDGKLTRAEWNERIESDLAFADDNEDGKVTLKELSHARENIGIGDVLGMIF